MSQWPTISKGIFNPGYKAGMQESPAPSERDMTARNVSGDSGVTYVRVVQGSHPLNEVNMRKPFG